MAALWRRLVHPDQFQALLGIRPVARSSHFVLHRWEHTDAPHGNGFEQTQAAPGRKPECWQLFAPESSVWIGALIPKRWAKRAVTRNSMRRQIFALFGSAAQALAPGAYLVRLRACFDPQHYRSASSRALTRAVRQEILTLMAKA